MKFKKSKKERAVSAYAVKPLPASGLVRLPSILAVYPVGRTTLYKKIKEGSFPQPIKLGERTSAWDVAAVRQALNEIGAQS